MVIIHPFTIIYILLSLMTNHYYGLVFLYLFGFIHEFSHVLTAKFFHIKTKEIIQVLDTMVDDVYGVTFFLIWENNGWRWRDAKNFVPPNYETEDCLI